MGFEHCKSVTKELGLLRFSGRPEHSARASGPDSPSKNASLSLVLSPASVNPDDFYTPIHPIGREVNPAAARPARAHLLLDHLFSVDLELHLARKPGLRWCLILSAFH